MPASCQSFSLRGVSGPEHTELQRSSRDPEALRVLLARWLAQQVGDDSASVGEVRITSATGMSSETVLFDARWSGREQSFVARIPPDTSDVPVFASYEVGRQFHAIRLVRE